MRPARFVVSLVLTHLPYWLAAAYLVFTVRKLRRSLESLRDKLQDRDRPGP